MSESKWITEALVQFSESPIWVTPIDNFVDDNCCVFSPESEMKLEYTIVHNKFKELVDSLLTCFVMELGVTMEAAVESLQDSMSQRNDTPESRAERHAAKKMLKQILNADNFSYFYTMMMKRNLELDIMASAALAARGVGPEADTDSRRASQSVDDAPAPARAQRAIDANGDVDEEEALRRAIAVSLQDSAAQDQMRVYNEVCVRENVNTAVATVEIQASREKAQLEAALQTQAAAQDPATIEQMRQEQLQRIDQQKESHIQQIHNYALSGRAPNVYAESDLPTAEFSSPELPVAPAEPSAPAAPAPAVPAPAAPAPAAPAAAPAPAPAAPVAAPVAASAAALPPIGNRQGALPSIPGKAAPAATGAAPPTTAPAGHGATHAPIAASPAAAPAPTKEELVKRAAYMKQQREMILARNRANRQEQLDTFVQNNGAAGSGASGAAAPGTSAAGQALTVEIARRLRGDLIGEGRRSNA